MRILDLITDAATGQMSHTKLWANIGYGAMTYAFLADALSGGFTDMKLFAYGAIVAGSATASKMISYNSKGVSNAKSDTTSL